PSLHLSIYPPTSPPTSTLFPYTTLFRSRSHDRPGDPSRIVLIRFAVEQIGQLSFRPSIHNLVRRQFVFGVHAHVERTGFAKGKSSRGLVKLHARNPQVGQDPVRRRNPQLACDLRNPRSEEHTSELQSRFDLVCRL